METKLNTVQIIRADDDFAFLENDTLQSYDYRFNFIATKSTLAETGANQLVIRLYKNNPKNIPRLSIFRSADSAEVMNITNLDGDKLVKNIQRRAFGAVGQISAARADHLLESYHNLPFVVSTFNQGIAYAPVDYDVKTGLRNSVYETSKTLDQQRLNDDKTYSQLSREMLMDQMIDPAESIARIYSADTPFESNNGLTGEYQSTSTLNFLQQQKEMVSSLLSSNVVGPITSETAQSYDITQRDNIRVHVKQSIPSTLVEHEDFYVLVSVYDVAGTLVQEFVKYVEHKKHLTFFERIRLAPKFSAVENTDGTVSFTLQQTDRFGTGVRIYKTVFPDTLEPSYISQELVGNYDVAYGEQKRLTINLPSYGLVLLRAISYDKNGDFGADFSSQVLRLETNGFNEDSDGAALAGEFISLQSKYILGGLELIIADIPDGTVIVKLLKTNIDIDPNKEEIIHCFFVGGLGKNASYCYVDKNIDEYRSYRYRCLITDTLGQEYFSSAVEEIYYRPITEPYASVTVTDPIVTPIQTSDQAAAKYDVTFTVGYAINKTLEDNVKQFLVNQGLIEYHNASIDSNRLKQLLMTKVELRDLGTNEKFFLTFTDSSFRQSSTNFGLLATPSRYVYELTTYFRSPNTLLAASTVTKNSTHRIVTSVGGISDPTYTYKPMVYDHPFALLQGSLPKSSGDEFVSRYGLNQLDFGYITSIDYVPVDLRKPLPSVTGLRAVMFNSQNVQLMWSVNGNQGPISHFIIRRLNVGTGKVDIIGKAHGINVQNSYSFLTPIRYTETGVFRYIITMQYFDLSLSPDYTSNEVVY